MTSRHTLHRGHDPFAPLMTGGAALAGLAHVLGFAIIMFLALT